MSETEQDPPSVRQPLEHHVRRHAYIDVNSQTVEVRDPNRSTSVYKFTEMPEHVRAWAMMQGFWAYLRAQDDPDAAFDKLAKGELPAGKPATTGPKVSTWRQAVALALVEATKKSAEPMTADQAREKAAAMSREALMKAKADPLVVKHHAKLTGSSGKSILDLVT